MRSYWRFLIAIAILGGTALLLHARNSAEIIPPRPALSSFPRTVGGWTGVRDVALPKEILDVLGPGDFLTRTYFEATTGSYADLFIAYFPSQRSGDTIHSPKNCLPGAGWTPIQSDRVTLALRGQTPFRANRYVIAQGENRDLVLYWYLAHNRAVASEYSAKFYLVTDSIRMHRTDGSLIRLVTGISRGETVGSAQSRLLSLANAITPVINDYVPR
jgi:EpsI family protein